MRWNHSIGFIVIVFHEESYLLFMYEVGMNIGHLNNNDVLRVIIGIIRVSVLSMRTLHSESWLCTR